MIACAGSLSSVSMARVRRTLRLPSANMSADCSPFFGRVSGAQIDRYDFETLNAVTDQVKQIEQTIRNARSAQRRTTDGAPRDDVRAGLVRVSLANMPDGPEKSQLLAIPTGLTLRPHVVAGVAGEAAITTSEPLRRFLNNYPRRRRTLPASSVARGTPDRHEELSQFNNADLLHCDYTPRQVVNLNAPSPARKRPWSAEGMRDTSGGRRK